VKRLLIGAAALALMVGFSAVSAQQFEGVNVCKKCHVDQADAWAKTPHAKAMDSLKPKVKATEKKKAGLDPDKDYTQDNACLQCHSTGYGQPGGYTLEMAAADAKHFANVGCESCHGAGSLFRKEHGKADDLRKSQGELTSRDVLVKAGQNFDYQEACASCHLNYEGSNWKGAHAPFTPFTPKIDAKYAFDFLKEALRSGAGAGVHEHYKLKGVFKGEPVPPIRAEIQKTASEPD